MIDWRELRSASRVSGILVEGFEVFATISLCYSSSDGEFLGDATVN